MSYNKKLLQQITERLNKPTRPNVPRNQWQHPGEITSIPSKNITMRGVTYPVLGVDANGYAQMMQPGGDYTFTQGPVVEYPMMQKGGPITYEAWKKKYNLRETPDYNLKRAWELGYTPDATGHLPTVDDQTGMFLKAKGHPTLQLEIDWYNSPEGAEFRSRNIIDSSGKYYKYVPRPKMQVGGQRKFPKETLTSRTKAYKTIRPSDYYEASNYARWFFNNEREEFDDPRSEEAFRMYLGLENNPKYFIPSKYRPTINPDPNGGEYYQVDPQLEQEIFDSFKDKVKMNQIKATGENAVNSNFDLSDRSVFEEGNRKFKKLVPGDDNMIFGRPMASNARALGNFVVSRGKDDKGEYLSYSDQYDFPDWAQSRMQGIPYKIYGRVYYPKKASGGQHGGLDRWFAEKWVDVKTGEECGRDEGEKRGGYPACRPSRRVNDDTPKTASELSSSERAKFIRSKTSSERIDYQHRRKEYGGETNESDMANKPNNPSLWSKAKSLAKEKYDVYPSAYANGWAAKWYKDNGGTWRKAGYGMEVMSQGGTNNPGFEALPEYVQAKILANMGYGGMTHPFMAEGGPTIPFSPGFYNQLQAEYNQFYTPRSPYRNPMEGDDGFDAFYRSKTSGLPQVERSMGSGWVNNYEGAESFSSAKPGQPMSKMFAKKKGTKKFVDDYKQMGDNPMKQVYSDAIRNMVIDRFGQKAPIQQVIKMQNGGEPDGAMALGQIDAAMDKLMKLRKFIQPDSDLEPWVSSKLTLMDHYTDAVSDYMQYNPEAQGDMMPEEEMMMEEGGGIPERYKNMGFSRVGQKKESTSEGKKWMVLAKKGDDYKVVHGGYDGMEDYTQHGSEQRRENFWNRMGGRDSAKAQDPFSPLYWHKRFGTWESGGYVGYDGKRHISKTPTWNGIAGFQSGGDTTDPKPEYITVDPNAVGSRFRDMLQTVDTPRTRPSVQVRPTQQAQAPASADTLIVPASPVVIPTDSSLNAQDSAWLQELSGNLPVIDSTGLATNPAFGENPVNPGSYVLPALGTLGAVGYSAYKMGKKMNENRLDPDKLEDFQKIIKNRGYREANDLQKLKELGMKQDEAQGFLKGMSFDKPKTVVPKPPVVKRNILTDAIDEATWKSFGFEDMKQADQWINDLPNNIKAQFMQLRKSNPDEIRKEVGAMLKREREDRIVQQGIEQSRRAQAIERGKKGREAALQNAAARPAESADMAKKRELREANLRQQSKKVKELEKGLADLKEGTKAHTQLKSELTQARRSYTRIKNTLENVVPAVPTTTPIPAAPSVMSLGDASGLPSSVIDPSMRGMVNPIELRVDLPSPGAVAREASMLDDFRNSGVANAIRRGMQYASESKNLRNLAKFFTMKEDGGEYYPMMQYQTKGQVKEEDIDWYNEMVKIIDPTGISSYGDAYETFNNPNATNWDKLGAGLSVLPMVGKVGKLGKVLDLSKAATSKWGKAWNASKKAVSKGLDMVDNVVSYPARQMDEYSPVHRMYNKATGQMIERTNPNRFVRNAANFSSLNNLGNRGANAYGFMWDGMGELVGANDPRYSTPKKKMGGIHIDPSKKGTFKAQASKMGMGVQQAAAAILRAPEGKYSPEMRKKANFARNFAKQDGGPVVGDIMDVTPEQLEMLRQQGYEFEII
jgi:hypothetical protein